MGRLARVVVPGVPHHVTQRGNRRLATFFNEADYAAYPALMAEWCGHCDVRGGFYCVFQKVAGLQELWLDIGVVFSKEWR